MTSETRRKSPTIVDVARVAGIDKATASRALNGKGYISASTREAALKAAHELGYQVNPLARRLREGHRNKAISLFSLELDQGVSTRKLQIIQRVLSESGFSVPIYGYGARSIGETVDQASLVHTMCGEKPQAVICNVQGLSAKSLKELKRYTDGGGVLVCYDSPVDIDCDQVIFDNEDNTYQTAKHLLELGHRKLGLFIVGREVPAENRLDGFQRALKEFGGETRKEWLFRHEHHRTYTEFEEGGLELAEQFLKLRERPTALCIVNDYCALAFVAEIHRAGVRVPQDVSVAGHDDALIARCNFLPLTTISNPVQEIAHNVIHLVQSRLDGTYLGAARHVVLKGKLAVRASTAPPRK